MTYMDAYGNQAGSGLPVRTPSSPGYQPIETGAPRVPPSSSVTEIVPDGIHIGQRPTKPCDHDFSHLRTYRPGATAYERAGEKDVDVFFCRRCLEYREVKR